MSTKKSKSQEKAEQYELRKAEAEKAAKKGAKPPKDESSDSGSTESSSESGSKSSSSSSSAPAAAAKAGATTKGGAADATKTKAGKDEKSDDEYEYEYEYSSSDEDVDKDAKPATATAGASSGTAAASTPTAASAPAAAAPAAAASAAPAKLAKAEDSRRVVVKPGAVRLEGVMDPRADGVARMLSYAARNEHKKVQDLISTENFSPNTADYDKRTALHLACSEGAMETVKYLVEEAGAEINVEDRFGRTPLDDAVDRSDEQMILYMRSHDAHLGPRGGHQAKMITAASNADMATVGVLMSAGVDVNCADYDGRTPLHLAVAVGDLEGVKQLVKFGADATREDRWGISPLKEAQRLASRVGSSPIYDFFAEELQHKGVMLHTSVAQRFWIGYGLVWLILIILVGVFGEYSVYAGNHKDTMTSPGAPPDAQKLHDHFTDKYPLFQDVNVMIFIGFGFLMTFLKAASYTAIGYTYLLAAFCVMFYQLTRALWETAFKAQAMGIRIDLDNLLNGDFCAGSLLITFGVVLGKVSPSQMLMATMLLALTYSLNERIGLSVLGQLPAGGGDFIGVTDIGGTMTIHLFGAVFGLAFSLLVSPKSAKGHEHNAAVYHSDVFAMIGTVFLWLYWPSFNAATGDAGARMNRAVSNTFLSLCGSCVAAFLASYALRREKQFNMVDIQNATLAGGVAVGAMADLVILPGVAIAVGTLAGIVSVTGYVYVQPWLETKFGLLDTCGVNNLHGMPSFLGSLASVIAVAVADQYADVSGSYVGGRSGALSQLAYIGTTIGIALISGLVSGVICRQPVFEPIKDTKQLFNDQSAWETPKLETPYYHDTRGEVARGLANEVAAVETESKQVHTDIEAIMARLQQLERATKDAKAGAAKV